MHTSFKRFFTIFSSGTKKPVRKRRYEPLLKTWKPGDAIPINGSILLAPEDAEAFGRQLQAERKTSIPSPEFMKEMHRQWSAECTCNEFWDGDGHQPGCELFPGW
jgi:hypothetical protein